MDTTSALRGDAALQVLVRSVVEIATPADESQALEWKSTLDLTGKAGCFAVARTVLGLANREPTTAARLFGGCGYIVIGAEPGTLHGIDHVDPAVSMRHLRAYIGGNRGPAWSPHWVTLGEQYVFVAVVEPPCPGDPIWPLRKTFDRSDAGTIFVRREGHTEPADDSEIDMLSSRAKATEQTTKGIVVEVVRDGALPWFDESVIEAEIGSIADYDAALMLQAARAEEARRSGPAATFPDLEALFQPVAGLGLGEPDARTLDEFVYEVENWKAKTIAAMSREWARWYCRLAEPAVRIVVHNHSATFYKGVEVRVQLDIDQVRAHEVEGFETRMPQEPHPFGKPVPFDAGLVASALGPSPYLAPDNDRALASGDSTWIDEGSGVIDFEVAELRPEDSASSGAINLLIGRYPENGHVDLPWKLTARDVHEVQRGTLTLAVGGEPVDTRAITQAGVSGQL